MSADGEGPARWRELTAATRASLEGRLAGLYGAPTDEAAFDALGLDKRRALLLFARRLSELKIWRAVVRVRNVYGVGGVGMEFAARQRLAGALSLREDFTARFAAHRGSAGGFRERGVRRAALHFLFADDDGPEGRRWSVHFDLDNPLASPLSALRHLYREVWRGATPDWRAIEQALGRSPSSS
ncbi:MAG TPA: hypothetical protein VGV38_20195 [Pyrinomonadaceae bacterium]|nr:hypothetical protein [Pyrinomonadaceae bacterium]